VDEKDGGWSFSLKTFSSSSEVQIWFIADHWDIPHDLETYITMEVDGFGPWEITAYDHYAENNVLWSAFDTKEAQDTFLEEFVTGRELVINFSGDEPTWRLSLNGSTAVAIKFFECVKRLEVLPHAPPQPFSTDRGELAAAPQLFGPVI
jgi:hypothetical protein